MSKAAAATALSTGSTAPYRDEFDTANTYMVSLIKREATGLGFLVREREEMPYLSVWELCKNGAAETTGKIKKGDILLRVNNHDFRHISYDRGLELIKALRPGNLVTLTLQAESDRLELPTSSVNSLSIKKQNGLMSPLQKIKKKFINCTSPNVSFDVNTLELQADKFSSKSRQLNKTSSYGVLDSLEKTQMRKSSDHNLKNLKIISGYNAKSAEAYIEKMIQQGAKFDELKTNNSGLKSWEASLKKNRAEKPVKVAEPDANIKPDNKCDNPSSVSSICSNSQVNTSTNAPTLSSISSSSMNKEILIELHNSNHICEVAPELVENKVSTPTRNSAKLKINYKKKTLGFDHVDSSDFPGDNKIRSNDSDSDNYHILSGSIGSNFYSNDKLENEFNLNLPVSDNEQMFNKRNRSKPKTAASASHSYQSQNRLDIIHHNSNNLLCEPTRRVSNISNYDQNKSIQIIQDGEEISIKIDGNIEIVTNRLTDRRVISISPQCPRRAITNTLTTNTTEKGSVYDNQDEQSNFI